MKRKSSGSTSTASGAIPPTQRPRTGEADEAVETTLTAENWAELHEFDAWLETPEATRIRKGHVHTDKQTVQHLLVHPLARAALQSAGSRLGAEQNREALVLWHDRCVQKALQDFRRWRQGLFASWTRKGPQPAPPDTMDAGTFVETVTEMRERPDYWWTAVLTRSFRRCSALQTKHPQLLTGEEWKTLLTRLQLASQSSVSYTHLTLPTIYSV